MQCCSIAWELNSDSVSQKRPHTLNRRHSGRMSAKSVFGFPLDDNQFSTLDEHQSAETQCQREEEMGLVDPRTTRHLRTAAIRAEERGSQADASSSVTVPSHRTAQGHLYSEIGINPIAIRNSSQFFVPNSFSAISPEILTLRTGEHVHYPLESGVSVGDGETLYDDFKCNKRISCAGPERSAGRPGHTPIRRILACDEHIEDRCAGQDWSAGRPGLTPFGASSAVCMSSHTACIGPYGTAAQQQHYTGRNTREEQSFTVSTSPLTTELPRHEDSSTIQ